MPIVSIVIPAYNAEVYITETLDCIINQTMHDIEIICVNDASSDRTLHIMEQFAKRDQRIVIINNENNQGAAKCRNIGIEKAKGKYISFLDADDLYSLDLIKVEYDAICKYNADMAVVHSVNFKGKLQDGDYQWYAREYQWEEQCVSVKNSEQSFIGNWNIAPWNKMYKKEFINSNNLEYQDLSSSNDVFFGMMALFLAEKIVLVESSDPKVFHRTDTAKRISTRRTPCDAFLAFEKVHDSMVSLKIWNKYFEEYFKQFYNTIINEFRRCKNEDANQQTYRYIAEEGLQKLDFFRIPQKDFGDNKTYQGLCNFVQYSYNGAWFWSYEQRIQKNAYMVILKLKSYDLDEKKIVVWGAGVRAGIFIKFCKANNCNIDFIVDKDLMKHGKYIAGMKIHRFEEVSDLTNIVIVLNSCFYEEIEDTVKSINPMIEVFDFEQYLSMH